MCHFMQISIHAPAWGATRETLRGFLRRSNFNPRARVGRDVYADEFELRERAFQSTRPRGARLKVDGKILDPTISIHAPAWGATHAF